MNRKNSVAHTASARWPRLALSASLGMLLCALLIIVGQHARPAAQAGPLPGGSPKLSLSTKTVSPTLAAPGHVTLTYHIRLVNTGAWTATAASLYDALPTSTTFVSGSLQLSGGQAIIQNNVLTWTGVVSFDSAVEITFSVRLDNVFTSGQVVNTAVVSDPMLAAPVTLTAVTTVTNVPILYISKSISPRLPGPNKPLVYTLAVSNHGQDAVNLPITVTDRVPLSTTLRRLGPDGAANPAGDIITWTRTISLALGETAVFTFSVDVGDVPSGTVITNADYEVASPETGLAEGKPYTVTVIDPVFILTKQTWPDPPGSNREMTYTLTLVNMGSLATNLVITDRVPQGVTYVRGGSASLPLVGWTLPQLDTGEIVQLTYTVYISDVMNTVIVNDDYGVCSAEDVCEAGQPLTSVVGGPTFEVTVVLDPIAKKPGGGSNAGPVTPTLVVRNLGPGNALDATALLKFANISVEANDLYAIPAVGTPPPFPDGPACDEGNKCRTYVWTGDIACGDAVTFTTYEGQSTVGGEEGNLYTATLIITDALDNTNTAPFSDTATGQVTHYANLLPVKSAPSVIGRGQLMTYTIKVLNTALATDEPPYPVLQDVVPPGVTVVRISDGGVSQTLTGTLQLHVISWTLPAMGTGSWLERSFTVRVDDDLVSGTQIVNDNYRTEWYELEMGEILSNTGKPVTTTVLEVGLIDSYKEVTPTLARPGPHNVLTYYVHVVNSSALPLTGVTVRDIFPWQSSTYQRDAVASAGQIVSDIVTLDWTGSIAPFSEEVITFTVLVDPYYQGPVTNTAIISHPNLLDEVVAQVVAYITDKPVLRIAKSASPDPVRKDAELTYNIHVTNLGQQATGLVITDVIPANTEYIAGGQRVGDQVRWQAAALKPGASLDASFRVRVLAGPNIVNARYAAACAEGIKAAGKPVTTRVIGGARIYLPIVVKGF